MLNRRFQLDFSFTQTMFNQKLKPTLYKITTKIPLYTYILNSVFANYDGTAVDIYTVYRRKKMYEKMSK